MVFLLVLSFLYAAEKPLRVDEEGVYYYKEHKNKKRTDTKYGPARVDRDGVYYYDTDKLKYKDSSEKHYGNPMSTKGSASYYKREESEQNNALTFQFAKLAFDEFENAGVSFENVYDNNSGLLLDFEWPQPLSAFKLGYIFSSGFLFSSGRGSFTNPSEINLSNAPEEKYQLMIVPLAGKIRLNFQYSDRQYVVPYLDAGAGVYGIIERRDDGDDTKRAYTPIFLAGGGLHFLMDWMNEQAIAKVDNEFGVNHIWLTLSYNLTVATESDFDLSSNQLQFGFKFDY